jgi:hypothetical protein
VEIEARFDLDLSRDIVVEAGDSTCGGSSPSSTLGGSTKELDREFDWPSVKEILETALASAARCSLKVFRIA